MARLARRHVGTVFADRGEDVLVEPVAELFRSASVRACRQTVDVGLGDEGNFLNATRSRGRNLYDPFAVVPDRISRAGVSKILRQRLGFEVRLTVVQDNLHGLLPLKLQEFLDPGDRLHER